MSAAEGGGDGFRAGFGCLVGRPNSGKSTLLNALVGDKVAITSPQPQTTRHAVRGIVNRSDGQLVLIDTPGMHRPRTLLGERLGELVRSTLADVDVIGLCVPADQDVGPGDRYITAELTKVNAIAIAIVTKSDLVGPQRLAQQLLAVAALADWADVIPVSAVTGYQIGELIDLLIARLPTGPRLYPVDDVTDASLDMRVAELVREAALDGVRDEVPHSIAVVVEEMGRRPDQDLIDVHAVVFVERASQKAIVIGAGGRRLRDVGIRAREEIERLLGSRVYLDLRVKVAADWQRDPKQLRRLGF